MFYFLFRIKFPPLSLTLEVAFLKFCSFFLSPIPSVLHFMGILEKEKKSYFATLLSEIFSQGRCIDIKQWEFFLLWWYYNTKIGNLFCS